MNPQVNIEWLCPKCQRENVDDYSNTSSPTCDNCGYNFWLWDDVLTPIEMEDANRRTIEQIVYPLETPHAEEETK